MVLSDYSCGIVYAIGCITKTDRKNCLVVRSIDKHPVSCIASETGRNMYASYYNELRDGCPQWVVKVRNMDRLPKLFEIKDVNAFCRGYIEIHGLLDFLSYKNKKNEPMKKLRLRIYGQQDILNFINNRLPAGIKKIQHIKSQTGETFALYYQSPKEIQEILNWIDGYPKNKEVWNKWRTFIQQSTKV